VRRVYSSAVQRPVVSVVVPVYKCAECLRHLHERLVSSLNGITGDYELIFVDDRSPDDSWPALTELAAHDPRIRLVRLSRNFGQHAAITAGLSIARGRWTVVMDCDLQDPPEQIPRLYAKAQEGFDIVYARRVGRQHSWFRRAASATYFRVLNVLTHTELSPEFGNFSIISEKVRVAYLAFRDKDRHYLMILNWLGFEHTAIEFPHAERYAGESAYTLGMLIRFALAGLFFQTTTLLRWIVYFGFGISFVGAGLAVFFVVNYFLGNPYQGWTSLGVLLLLIGGFIIVSTGVTGLYIGKIFTQVKDRPLFVVDTTVNAEVQSQEVLPLREAIGEAPPRRTAF
jgi:glycosyltransferase involved in cell wall biosynthesis